ncbi:MAG: hypothetical protein QM676_02010 [Novosphingobium sp.]
MTSLKEAAALLLAGCAVLAAAPAHAAGPGTIGLVVTDIRYALYETPDAKEECPDGLQVGEIVQFKAMPGLAEHMAKFGGTAHNRGPNGENSSFVPLAITDPIPFRELRTTKGYGLNLDGTQDGRATARTLAHGKFTDPETGEKVDNQMARVMGCVMGWRKTGFMAEFYSTEVATQPPNRFLIEISGVDDEKNDPDVTVTFYKGIDRVVKLPDGGYVPGMSHRIDPRATDYMFRTSGRIVNGVLETAPMPLFRQTMRQIEIRTERRMRDARFRIALDGNNPTGIMSGYEPIDTWWSVTGKGPGSDPGRYSPAGLYRAALKYADGYPDPATGKATAISVAYKIKAVRALIVHPEQGRAQVAANTR